MAACDNDGFDLKLKMVSLLRGEKTYILFDIFLTDCESETRTSINKSLEEPIHIIIRRHGTHYLQRDTRLDATIGGMFRQDRTLTRGQGRCVVIWSIHLITSAELDLTRTHPDPRVQMMRGLRARRITLWPKRKKKTFVATKERTKLWRRARKNTVHPHLLISPQRIEVNSIYLGMTAVFGRK